MKRYVAVAVWITWLTSGSLLANDWPFWRGPEQTGMTREKAVVKSWSQEGENLLWKAPVGGRTTPVVMDGRVYMITPVGEDACMRERVICLDADTGETIWEHRFSVFHTDIVRTRLGWTSVVGDPETGNIYAHGTGGVFFCFNRDGKVLWKRSLGEAFGRYSGYGGRLHTPIIDEDRVVVSIVYILSNWGTGKAKAGHRYLAFDKHTGEVVWWSQPGGRPLDTTYSVPVVTVINGRRMLIGGNADGCVYGMLARTGERVWTYCMSKRGLNTSVVVDGKYVYATHSEENLDGTAMGRVVCIDGSNTGDITESGEVWRVDGLTVGYSSPALANGRLYVVTNSANLICLDAKTGKRYWEYSLGTVMKGSPVVTSDGIIYTGEVNGQFHILKDAGDHCESLDVETLTRPKAVVEMNGSPAVVNGRVYFMTSFNTYCLGAKDTDVADVTIPPMDREVAPDPSKPDFLQIVPEDAFVWPGDRLALEAKLFDVNGRLIDTPTVNWSVKGVNGRIEGGDHFVAATDSVFSAGLVEAKFGKFTSSARVRIGPRLPIHETFDNMQVGQIPPGWYGMDLKSKIVERDGEIVLQKLAKSPSAPYMRMRAFSIPPIPAGYTVQADLLGTAKQGRRTVTLPDMGLINSRYKMILLGKEQAIRLVAWAPIPRIQKDTPFTWEPEKWYTAKFSMEIKDGEGILRAKAWPRGEEEPSEWNTTLTDPCPNIEGSPGLYGYSKGTTASRPGATIFYDNFQVYRND